MEKAGKPNTRKRPYILGIITETRYPGSNAASLSQDDIDGAIERCWWRVSQFGVDICAGNLTPCYIEICNGTCDTLKKLIAARRKDAEE